MTMHYADAFPRKRLFIDMFIRDISFEDCILDLIDNAVDGFVRSRDINLARSIVDLATEYPDSDATEGRIEVKYSANEFVIRDNCGGISRQLAEHEIFNFGHSTDHEKGPASLGVYGIGMKRALFKIGRHFSLESRTPREGFVVEANLDEWASKDDDLKDWRFPLKLTQGDKEGIGFTEIRITKIRDEIRQRLKDDTFQKTLYRLVSQAYALFLGRKVTVVINGETVAPSLIPIGESKGASLGFKKVQIDGVSVQLLAGLAERGERNEWRTENAGWYVACNGRMVVFADKTELTGWSMTLPTFVSKYRGFIGLAFFFSADPLKLPWTTTKRGINRESDVFLQTRAEMLTLSKPVLKFLDRMYSSEAPEETAARKVADTVKRVDVKSLKSRQDVLFTATVPERRVGATVRIQYTAEKATVDSIQKHLNKPKWTPNRVGEHTFKYFLEAEGIE